VNAPARPPTHETARDLTLENIRRISLLLVALAAVIASAAYLIWKVGGIGNGPCGSKLGWVQQGGIVAACLTGLTLGRVTASRRAKHDVAFHEARKKLATNASSPAPIAPSVKRPRLVHPVAFLKSGEATGPNAAKRGAVITHLALAFVYVSGVLALAYETVGVWTGNPWHLPPITHFVRCARDADVAWTMLVASSLSFLAGHWLWWPGTRR
jgi:hypothetical protein